MAELKSQNAWVYQGCLSVSICIVSHSFKALKEHAFGTYYFSFTHNTHNSYHKHQHTHNTHNSYPVPLITSPSHVHGRTSTPPPHPHPHPHPHTCINTLLHAAAFPFFYIEPSKKDFLPITRKFTGPATKRQLEEIAPIGEFGCSNL